MSLLALPMLPADWPLQMVVSLPSLFWLMVGSSVTTFLSLILYVRALGKGSMSVVNSLSAISVVLGLPITAIGNLFLPGGFGELTSDPFLWVLKTFGVVLVMVGIIALQASDVRSIVLIRVKPHTEDILPELFDIRGVQTASALAGTHDYLLTIKSRTLAKTRTKILNKIQRIDGIEDIETLVVIREYK
jgi:uncharacterized membrane protein